MPVLTHPARPDIQRLSGLLVLAGPSGAGPAFRSELEAAKQWDPGSSSPHSGGPKCTGLVERAIRLVLRQHGVSPERPLVDAVAAGAAAAPTLNKLSSLMGGNWKSWHDGGELAVRRWRGALFPRPYLTPPPPPLALRRWPSTSATSMPTGASSYAPSPAWPPRRRTRPSCSAAGMPSAWRPCAACPGGVGCTYMRSLLCVGLQREGSWDPR